jgi:hypothetical protein
MEETYFTANPDEASPIGLLDVPIVGQESAHHNARYAELIGRAIKASEIDDPHARVMEAFYGGNGFPRELVPHIEPTIKELYAALPVRDRLSELMEANPTSVPFKEQELAALDDALGSEYQSSITYLRADGLVIDPWSQELALHSVSGLLLALQGKEERTIATGLGTETYICQTELVWRTGEGGEAEPSLLSDRQHIALGHIAADGMFEQVFTILAQDHPARRPVEI